MTLYSVSTCYLYHRADAELQSISTRGMNEVTAKNKKIKLPTTKHLTFLSIKNLRIESDSMLHNFTIFCCHAHDSLVLCTSTYRYCVSCALTHLRLPQREKKIARKREKKRIICMHKNWSGKLKVNIFARKFSVFFLFLYFILFAYYFVLRLRLRENFLLD